MNLTIRLMLTLAVVWLLLSGMFQPTLLVLGVLSVLLVTWLSRRMQVLEHRGQPVFFRLFGILRYWVWLFGEIIKSNLTVVRIVLDPALPIRPRLRRIKATPATEIGRVVYANSITLTPGTTAINFTPTGEILVHALHEENLDELERGEMASRVRLMEPPAPIRGSD